MLDTAADYDVEENSNLQIKNMKIISKASSKNKLLLKMI